MDASETVNVATHLARLAADEPDRPAIIMSRTGESRTFRQLHEESDRLAHGLSGIGIGRGTRTVLMVPPSLEFFTLTFALFKLGAVPVLIDPGMGIRNLGKCLAEAEPEAFIGVPKAHAARNLLGWAKSTLRTTVTTGRFLAGYSLGRLRGSAPQTPFPLSDTKTDETAAILFTSGSTGPAKGVVYTHGIFASQVEMLRKMYVIKPGEVDLSTFPLFALFGPALGMTAIVPDMNPTRPALVDPKKIIRAIEKYRVTNMFGSPALINRVGAHLEEKNIKLPTLRRVISAGAPVPAAVIERFTKALSPGVQVHTPYGATESLPVATIGSGELLNETRKATEAGCGVCVGRPVEGMRVRIVPISDGPMQRWNEAACLRVGEIGEITVSGPVVTLSYFNRPQANNLAKVRDAASGEVWHRMGDVGYFDSLGRLWFCGRKSQRVVTEGGTLFTIPAEAIFSPWGNRRALVGVKASGRVQPVMCFEFPRLGRLTWWLPPWGALREEWRRRALQFPHTAAVSAFLVTRSFPVDVRHNSKIFREKLAAWAERQLGHHRWPETGGAVALPPTFDEWAERKVEAAT